jgi:serine/threonine protein kinase
MASGVRRLHFAGLAHSDLSHNNVLIDPKHGDACVIDCDSLVVPGLAPPTVMGTPGYIAPEVVAGRKQPSIETDLHALAVLIYESLLLRHPLAGPKVRSVRSPEEDDMLSMGAQALYVEHPQDRSNHLQPAPEIPVARLGPYLDKLFQKTFITGLHTPHLRASASEWEKGLQKTLDLIHPSPDGKNWFIVAPGMPLECPFSKRRLTAPVPVASFLRHIKRPGSDTLDFKDDEHGLTVWNGQYLYPWHARSNVSPLDAKRDPVAYFTFHQGKWFLVNQSGADMLLVDQPDYLRHGHAVELTPGLRVLLSLEEGGRLAVFDFLEP